MPETADLFHVISVSLFPFLMRIQLLEEAHSCQEIYTSLLKTRTFFLVTLIIRKKKGNV